jgi:hypothetical protein
MFLTVLTVIRLNFPQPKNRVRIAARLSKAIIEVVKIVANCRSEYSEKNLWQ